jgi:hypothetical protein
MKKYPKSAAIRAVQNLNKPAYISWKPGDEDGRVEALKESSKALEEYVGIAKAGISDFSNLLPSISGRPGLTREAYNVFRPAESIPTNHKEILSKCNAVYHNVGLIRNVIDLMGDFACQGIRIVNKNARAEKFGRQWFKKVEGKERSERFLNYLYRTANVIVRKQNAKINAKTEKKLYKTYADDHDHIEIETEKVVKREIPWKYTFLDPSVVNVIGGALASFIGSPTYSLELPGDIRRIILSPKNEQEKSLVDNLPADIKAAARSSKPYILPIDKTMVFHYKKDDWEAWAVPMIYSILKDAVALDKLKLADVAALDGAISNIRIFKLGSLEHKIYPTSNAVIKLAEILQSHTGVGTMDFIWGPDIEMVESNTQVHNFLGEEKYTATLNAIYAGLGIPPTLTGTFGASGTTNNFISLKTLTERLQYGREVILSFWEKELSIVQKAMGFTEPYGIEFDVMTLANEDAMKALYIRLAEENIVSDETIQRVFGQNPDMESLRVSREHKAREGGKMAEKAGPYFEAQREKNMQKIALQSGDVTPTEVGLNLQPRKPGEKTTVEKGLEARVAKKPSKKNNALPKGKSGKGRPKNTKDSSKRKTKTFRPRSKAMVGLWAKNAQKTIADILNPGILELYNKKNIRSLTESEYNEAERIKFGVLCNIKELSDLNEVNIKAALNQNIPAQIDKIREYYLRELKTISNKVPTVDDIHQIQAYAYAEYMETIDDSNI